MKKTIFYDKTKTYMYPSGNIATPESVAENYPATGLFPHIIETDHAEQVLYAIQNFEAMKDHYDIDDSLSDEEALAKINEIINTPAPEPEASAEERIAAALELQNMLSLPDIE